MTLVVEFEGAEVTGGRFLSIFYCGDSILLTLAEFGMSWQNWDMIKEKNKKIQINELENNGNTT